MASTINASTTLGLISSADTSGVLQLQTANIAAVTIDASQNVGVGTASPAYKLDVNGTVAVPNLFDNSGSVRFKYSAANAASRDWRIVSDIANYGDFGIQQSTTQGGATFDTKLMFSNTGNLLLGTTTAAAGFLYGYKSTVDGGSGNSFISKTSDSGSNSIAAWNAATTGNNNFIGFYTEGSTGTFRGSITYNRAGGLVAYNVTSDYRAKDISGPVTNSGALIDSVPVYMGTMKGATQERPMFIAHETPAYAHIGEKDAVDADGNPVYQQMDASSLIPVMWAEIQSLRQRLAVLEGK